MYKNIAVIGGGVVGVTTSLQLQKDIKNSRVTIFAEKWSPNTTGDVSAGFWTPYLLEDTPQSDIAKWSKVTHDILLSLWKKGYALEAGICLQPVLRLFTDENVEIPDWLKIPFGAFMMPKEEVEKLSKLHNKKYTGASHFVSFTCEPSKLLPMLIKKFTQKGGVLVQRKIGHFTELHHFDVIVNCTGLEARKLAKDANVHPIRGQVSRVKAPWQFQVISDESDDGFYIIPNTHDVILGGTHQHDENLSVNLVDKKRILGGCSQMAPGLLTCADHNDGVGLRPGRSKVRIEKEEIKDGNKTIKIVHNYGHGGAGVTLCFGCAVDASKLVKDALKTTRFNSRL